MRKPGVLAAMGLTTPEAGAGTPYTLNIGTGETATYSFTHVRGANEGCQVSIIYRNNSNPAATVTSVTADGVAMTIRAQSQINVVATIGVAVASIDPSVGNSGSQTIAVTLSEASGKDAVAWATNVVNTSGAQQGVSNTFNDAGDTAASVNITPSNAASFLLGIGGCRDGTGTVSAGASWTGVANEQSAADADGVEAVKQILAPGNTSVTACDVSFSASRTRRAIACVEWLPS